MLSSKRLKKFIFTPPIIIGLFLLLGAGITLGTIYLGGSGRTDEINLQKGLIGHWTLDGNAKDSTPYNNHGTIYGASSTADRKGQSGKALSFDGVDDYVEVPDSATLFKDGFESGDLSKWSSAETDGGDLSVTTGAKLHGTYGLNVLVNDTASKYVQDDTPNAEKRYRVRFYIDPNGLTMGADEDFIVINAYNNFDWSLIRVHFIFQYLGNYRIYAMTVKDGGIGTSTSWYSVSDVLHYIEVDWKASSAAEANDGFLSLYIDGVLKETLSNLDNDESTRRIDYVRLGGQDIDAGTSGTFYLDDFASNNTGTPIGLVGSASLDITNAITVEGWAKKNSQTILFKDGFESGGLTAWDANDGSGDLSAATAAKLHGNYGANLLINDTDWKFVQDETPATEKRYRVRFYLDPNGLTMADPSWFYILIAIDEGWGFWPFQVTLIYSGGAYRINVYDYTDGSSAKFTADYAISDAPHCIEIDWTAATAPSANNGQIVLIIDGVTKETLTGIDSDTENVGNIRWGAGFFSGTPSGTFYLDDFASNNTGTPIGPVGYLASKGENAYALKLDEDGSNLRGDINNTEISASVSNPTEWHHYALTYDGSNQKLYIDGILATTTSKTGSINTNSTNLRIGEYFNGFIDDVHIYNRALSAGEIKALYESYDPALRISDLQKGLVGYWTLDGNAKDSTPYGNNGTIYEASSTVDRKGKANGALSFDGVDDYVEVPNSASLNLTNGFTIEVWIKPQAAQFDSKLVTKVGVSNSFGFYYSPDMFYFYMTTSGSSWRASWLSQAPTLNLWQHLAVTYDNNNTFKFYRDGILIDTDTATWSGSLVNNSDSLNIGGGGWGGSPDIKTIDEVRIYNRALSAGEIKALYESYDPAPRISDLQKGLVGYWTLDGHAKDSTPYGNNGTIYGASSTADRKGQSGKALSFDGTDDHIAGSGQGIKGIINGTVQFWVKPLGRGYCLGNNQEGKVQVSNSSPLIYGIQEIGIYWIDASNEYPGSISLSDNIWTHIVVTWNNAGTGQANGEIKWYSDGIIKTSVSGLTLPVGTSNSFDIGGYSGESPFNGLIDEVRIYNRALSADEVKQLYESYQ